MVAELEGTGHAICENIRLVLLVETHIFSFNKHYFKMHTEWFVYSHTAWKKE
jgi:hypothetical protein